MPVFTLNEGSGDNCLRIQIDPDELTINSPAQSDHLAGPVEEVSSVITPTPQNGQGGVG